MKKLKRFFSLSLSFCIIVLSLSAISPKAKAAGVSVDAGAYYIINNKTGMYLNLTNNKDADGTTIKIVTPEVDAVGQVMKIKVNSNLSGGSYFIQPAQSTTRALNVEGTVPSSGDKVLLRKSASTKVQDWYFEKKGETESGEALYVIKSGYNANLCLTPEGSKKSSNVGVKTYSSKNELQLWRLVRFTLKKQGDDPNIKSYGVDVSQWQGEVNWQAVAEYGVEFAILRIAFSGRGEDDGGLDKTFYKNYKEAQQNGLKLGVYIYSYSTTVKEAKMDAEQVLEQLGGRYLDYPIFFDLEDECQAGLSKRLKTDMCLEFMRVIKEAGYEAGVYASENWFQDHIYYSEVKAQGTTWLAKWPKSDQADEDHSADEFWQFRSDGRVAGIDGGTGDVDMNACYYTPGTYVYTGENITPSFSVYSPTNGMKLTEGTHYTVEYKDNKNVGTGKAIITGIGEYVGLSFEKTFEILPRNIGATEITVSDKSFSGAPLTPNPKVVFDKTTLKKDKSYTLSYKKNTNVGTATITVKGKGNFDGSTKVTFKIKPRKLKNAEFEGIVNKVYTGKSVKLSSVKVKTSAITFKKGTDYTYTYKNNVNFGEAKIVFKAKGKRTTGTVSKTFHIVPMTPEYIKSSKTGKSSTVITWGHSDYATKYQLYRAEGKNGKFKKIYTSDNRWQYTYKDKSLKEGTYYYYKIRAYKSVGGKKYYSYWSDTITVKTKISDTAFSLKPDYDNKSIKVSIKKDKSVSGYILYMYDSSAKKMKKIWQGKSTSFEKTDIEPNKNYHFKIKTYKKANDGTIYGNLSEKQTVRLDYPEKVATISASSKSAGSIKLKWSEAISANTYQIYRATEPEGKFTRIGTTKTLSFTDSSAESGIYYYYKIRSYMKVGKKKYYSEWSDIIKKKAK